MVARILGTSRFLILIAVIGSFLASVTLIIYGGLTMFRIAVTAVMEGQVSTSGAKTLAVASIELMDVFLLGVVMYIMAAGLYKLFIGPIAMPAWLKMESLDQLKGQLIGVIIVLLAVTFLGQASTLHGGIDIFYIGVAVSLVILALKFTMPGGHGHADSKRSASSRAGGSLQGQDAGKSSPD